MSALAFPRRTVRLRLTLVYLGLFVVSAACLLVITYVLVAHQLTGDSVSRLSVSATNGSISISGVGGAACGQITSSSTPPPPAALTTCLVSLQQQARDAALDQLLIESGVALGIMAMASVGLGWLMAGRVLSPLRVITSAARRISASNLDRRIGMTGPDDELKELGETPPHPIQRRIRRRPRTRPGDRGRDRLRPPRPA